MKVLILEDEESIRGFVKINLMRNEMEVVEAETGEEALQKLEFEGHVDIAILDVMLPTIDGFEVCRQIRAIYPDMGIIMLTAKTQDSDKVTGLEQGADDYVVKPFSPTELIARIKALHRRLKSSNEQDDNRLESGPFTISLDERKLFKRGKEIDVTPTEYEIVKLFMENPRKGISRDTILDKVWGKHYIGDLKIVDVNIRRIRQKLEDDPSMPKYIETMWGYGYMWKG